MELFQPFSPSNGGTRNIVVTASSQELAFAAGYDSPQLLLTNSGTQVVFVRMSPTSTAATATAGTPILANSSKVVTRPTGDAMTLTAIAANTGSTLYVTPGIGF